MPCKHGAQAATAQFAGFFDDKVGARLFDGREDQLNIRRFGLRAALAHGLKRSALFPGFQNRRLPLAILAVKDMDRISRAQPHDIKQVMRLFAFQRDFAVLRERSVHKKSDDTHQIIRAWFAPPL